MIALKMINWSSDFWWRLIPGRNDNAFDHYSQSTSIMRAMLSSKQKECSTVNPKNGFMLLCKIQMLWSVNNKLHLIVWTPLLFKCNFLVFTLSNVRFSLICPINIHISISWSLHHSSHDNSRLCAHSRRRIPFHHLAHGYYFLVLFFGLVIRPLSLQLIFKVEKFSLLIF